MSDALIDELRQAHSAAVMVGWDFSRLDGRLVADEPWWDFESDCLAAMRTAARVLDLGTGGGERLVRLLTSLGETKDGATVVATEGWEPNIPEARTALAPYGVEVHAYDPGGDAAMPFADGEFDLIMSRHEGMDANEIARVLAPNGTILTQQVDGLDAEELHDWFHSPFLYPDVTAERYGKALRDAGLTIDVIDEWTGTMEFSDVHALVTYLGLVPWDVPGFNVDDHSARLRELSTSSPLSVTQRRFRIYASKAASR